MSRLEQRAARALRMTDPVFDLFVRVGRLRLVGGRYEMQNLTGWRAAVGEARERAIAEAKVLVEARALRAKLDEMKATAGELAAALEKAS